MTLQVIGSGLGRTGTKSMQTALNRLGFGPCHHMVEVFAHRETIPLWIAASKGAPDWEAIFAGYRSVVDWPAVRFWREIVARYPDAKVLHTTRDAEAWFASTQATIFSPANLERFSEGPAAEFAAAFLGELHGRLDDRAFMIDHFHRHEAEVKATIPAERLLVYPVGAGWAPLCDFLGVEVPDEPYPSENSRDEFVQRSAAVVAGLSRPV